jgi:hypothetical protein
LLDEFKLISYILNKKMKTEDFNKIVDEVYNHYLETHQDEPFILQEEMDLSKEDFIKKVTNNYGFGQLFGISLNERELSLDERFRIAYKNLDLRKELESQSKMLHYPDGHNKAMDEANIPTKLITIKYNDKTIESYE